VICFLLIAFISSSDGFIFVRGGGGGEEEEESWEIILALDDNAASTSVANTGTNEDTYTASANTSTFHSATVKEGTGSFNFDGNEERLWSTSNWTEENVIFQFWWYPTNATSADWEFICGVMDFDNSSEADEIIIVRHTGSDEICVRTRNAADNGATSQCSNDFSPSALTWYQIRVEVQSASSPWTVTLKYRTVVNGWTTLTNAGWDNGDQMAATVNDAVRIGTLSSNEPEALIDDFRVRSGT
jgi:hypothetical protein